MPWQPDYVTAAELRAFARIPDNADDVELGFAAAAASRAIDNHTNRQFGQVDAAEQRVYTPEWDRRRGRWLIEVDDLGDTTGLDIQLGGGEVTAYTLEPVNAKQGGRPYTRIVVGPSSKVTPNGDEYEASVTGLWGWSSIPVPVKQAALLQGSRFHFRRFAPAGVAGSPETGSEVRLLAKVDVDVAVALVNYVRWWAAA